MREINLDPSSSPWAAYGTQLRRSRKAKGLSQAQLGRLIGYSATYVSYLERGQRPATLHISVAADAALETGGTLELMWWSLRHAALVEGFPEFAGHEARADELRMFEPNVIPGLFQTAEYAAALAMADVRRGSITQGQAEERVAFLATRPRQQLFLRNPTPVVYAILDESCLRRPVGGREVLSAQLRHLEELSERPSIIMQVAPFELAERAPFTLAMTLLTLPDRTLLGYSESLQRGLLERDISATRAWEKGYDRFQVEALSRAASLDMIRAVREEMHP